MGPSGNAPVFVSVRVDYGATAVAVVGNTIRGGGTGTGLDYQAGTGTTATITSTRNPVTGVATPRRASSGVTVTAGV